MDILTIGEVLVEFVKKTRDSPHNRLGDYAGPFPSGAPAIFIDTAARLGLESGIIGAIGNDDFGRLISGRLREDRVDIRYLLTREGYTTGTAFVMYYADGKRDFIFHLKQAAAGQVKSGDVKEDYVKSFKVLHVMGSALSLGKTMREACYKAVRIASRSGMIVTYDPNLRAELIEPRMIRKISEPLMRASEIVMPSANELFDLTGERTMEEAAERVFKYGVRNLILKLGERGSIALTKEGKVYERAFDVPEGDPTGAGDAFDAAALHAYLRQLPMRDMLVFANAVGAIKVRNFGPMEVPKNISEVNDLIRTGTRKSKTQPL